MNFKPSRLAFLAALALPWSTFGQPEPLFTPEDPQAPAEEQPVFELEPFTVNTDQDLGYVAVDSLAGGRVRTPIKFTPSSVSALTETFLEDLAVQDVREALRWSPNVVPANPMAGRGTGGSAFHDWSFNYRGAGPGQQGGPGPTRNYFSFYQNADSYNVERIEFLRGPNSLVFGLGTVGGTLSIYTKAPRPGDDFIATTVTVDNHGSARFEADVNHDITDEFTARFNAVLDDGEGWRENEYNQFQAATLALMYRFTPRTTLRLEGEIARRKRSLMGTAIADKISGWDGTTASESWGSEPFGDARVQPIQNASAWGESLQQFYVWIPGLGENALLPWAGGYASTTGFEDIGTSLIFAPHAGFYPPEIRLPEEESFTSTNHVPVLPDDDWTYGNGLSETDYEVFTITLEHRFNENLDGLVSAYYYEDEQTATDYEGAGGAAIDINRQLPNADPNPNYGKAFADFFLSRQTQARTVKEARAQLNYSFQGTFLSRSWEQLFSASAAYKEVEINARQQLAQITNDTPFTDPADWQQNLVWGRVYFDEPNRRMNLPEVAPDGHRIEYLPNPVAYWFDFDDVFKLKDVAFMSHTRLFDDSLSILAGLRYDSYEEEILEYRRGEPDENGIGIDRLRKESDSGTTYSVGAVYYFHWLGLFANYSENIQPPNPGTQPLLNGSRPAPEEGSGYDYGIRISTDDGRYYAQISRYDTRSEGHLQENPIGFRGVWQSYYEANPDIEVDPLRDNLSFSDTTARDVKGWEFEVTANPTANIRLQASFAKPDAEIVNYFPQSRSYFAEHIDTWNAGLESAVNEDTAAVLRNQIINVENALEQSRPGAIQPNLVDYTASFFALYAFTGDSALDGLSIGGGFTRTGGAYLATFEGIEYWGTRQDSVNAVIAYETTLGGVGARFALNIDNLLDEDDPIITSYDARYTDREGRHMPNGYYLRNPRTIRLSAQFTF